MASRAEHRRRTLTLSPEDGGEGTGIESLSGSVISVPSVVVTRLFFQASKNAAGPALVRAPGLRNLTSPGTRESARVGGRHSDSPSTILRLCHLAGVYYCLNSKSHLPFALELPLRSGSQCRPLRELPVRRVRNRDPRARSFPIRPHSARGDLVSPTFFQEVDTTGDDRVHANLWCTNGHDGRSACCECASLPGVATS